MAKKQNDYLASLLAAETDNDVTSGTDTPAVPLPSVERAPPPPAPVRISEPATERAVDRPVSRAGLSLLGRENALARVANGEVRQVTQLLLDPSKVRIWNGNARIQSHLSEETCRDLIDSIVAEGGQKVPAVVRHLHNDPAYDYELIAGTRRHFAISWLRAHSYPEMKLLAHVAELDDEAAFRLADIENRARKDISDIERAQNYAAALLSHYDGKAVRMAERLKVSKGWLSKMLKAASIPQAILDAFANLQELTLNPAYRLACALDDHARAAAIEVAARRIVRENAESRANGSPPLPAVSVLKRLMAASASPASGTDAHRMDISGPRGRTILSVKSVNRQGITLHVPMASGAGDEQIVDALRQALEVLRLKGISVQ